MKVHRFYVSDTPLEHNFWLKDKNMFHQWTRVLRFDQGREVILFNQHKDEKLYKIEKIGNDAVHVSLITELEPKQPNRELYLCFSLLKKDKNDWILQKGTELGVRHFVPLLCDRTEKTGFDVERTQKIVIEAAEQCGRVDIPSIREPITLETVIEELSKKVKIFVAEQGSDSQTLTTDSKQALAVLIGPEGGWSDEEKRMLQNSKIEHLSLSKFTLRAETAAVTAASHASML